MLVLWYLDQQLEPNDFARLGKQKADKSNNVITFTVTTQMVKKKKST